MKTHPKHTSRFFTVLSLTMLCGIASPCGLRAQEAPAPVADTQPPVPVDANEIARIKRDAKLVPSANIGPATVVGRAWQALGPAPTFNGQITVPPNNEICGAIQAIAVHPTNPAIVWIGAVGGGVWKTANATAATPVWTPLTDTQDSLNIGAVEFDVTDGTFQTVVAGVARISNFAARGGLLVGVLRTTDGGANWTNLGAATFANENITSVAARGAIIMAASDNAQAGAGTGLFRSIDTGANFTLVSGAGGTGLPAGAVSDLVADPGSNTRFYCAVKTVGIFRSDDTGLTWTNITGTISTISGTTAKIEMAVHRNGGTTALYVGTIGAAGTLNGMWRSGDPTVAVPTWVQMDTPVTHNGGQGSSNFSICADRTNANLVYVGGDRINPAPFSANLFRGDASLGAGTQFTTIMDAGGGNTTPHADSRELVMDSNGNLLESDDGGIYRRTNPTSSAGTWSSVIGNLACFEAHDVAYDSVSNTAMAGMQDNGTHIQTTTPLRWTMISGGDGGDVAIDDTSSPGQSIRYSSSQNLGNFARRVFDATNTQVGGTVFPALTVLAAGPAIVPQFVTPVEVNKVAPTRIVIGGANTVYESLDQGGSVTALTGGSAVNRMALIAGGRQGAVLNPDVLYYGSGSTVRRRTTAGGAISATPTAFPGGTVQDVMLDPDDWTRVFVADSSAVYVTPDSGTTWTNITGNLTGVGIIRCLESFKFNGVTSVAAGTAVGVYITSAPFSAGSVWSRLGSGLPNAVAFDLDYDPTDNVLAVGTLGRSTFLLNLAPLVTPVASTLGDVVTGEFAPNGAGVNDGTKFDVLKRGGFIAENGQLVFPGNLLVGTGGVTASTFMGLWKKGTGNLNLLARSGNVAPEATNATYDILPQTPAINDAGEVTFLGSLTNGSGSPATTLTTDTALWSELGSTGLGILIREGDTIPGFSPLQVGAFASGAYATAKTGASTGEATFSITMKNGSTDTAILRTSITGAAVTAVGIVARENTPAPGAGENFNNLAGSFSDPQRMDATGNVVFAALTKPSNKEGLWYQPVAGGAPVKIFVTGDNAPGTTTTFKNIKSPAIGSGGVITFRGLLNNTGDNATGLRNDGIWRGTGGGAFANILRRGDAGLPGMPGGSKVGNLWHSWLTNANHGAWRGWLDVNGDGSSAAPADVYAIYTDLSGTMSMIVKAGDAAPGIAGATFTTQGFDLPVVGGAEQLAFLGTVTGGGVTAGTNDKGVWRSAPNGGALTLVLRTGDTVTTTQGAKTIKNVDFPGSGSTDRRWEQPVMDSTGKLLVFVTFTDLGTCQVLVP